MECKIRVLKKTDFSRRSGRDASKSAQVTSPMWDRHHVCQQGDGRRAHYSLGTLAVSGVLCDLAPPHPQASHTWASSFSHHT